SSSEREVGGRPNLNIIIRVGEVERLSYFASRIVARRRRRIDQRAVIRTGVIFGCIISRPPTDQIRPRGIAGIPNRLVEVDLQGSREGSERATGQRRGRAADDGRTDGEQP